MLVYNIVSFFSRRGKNSRGGGFLYRLKGNDGNLRLALDKKLHFCYNIVGYNFFHAYFTRNCLNINKMRL